MKKIVVYSTKQFSRLINAKLSVKAKLQPRRKDGRFAKPLPKPSGVEKNPLVRFFYQKTPTDGKLHLVRLISSTDTHFTGLDLVDMNNDKWQYKKFLADKAKNLKIMSFNPQAMS